MTSAPPDIRYDSDGRLDTDVRCVMCGHNLRSRRVTEECTECGHPVTWTFCGNPLNVADPQWIRSLRIGTAVVCLVPIWLWHPVGWLVLGYGAWRLTALEPGQHGRLERLFLHAFRVVFAWGLSVAVAVILISFDLDRGFIIPLSPGALGDGNLLAVGVAVYLIVSVVLCLRLLTLARRGRTPRLLFLVMLVLAFLLVAGGMLALWQTQVNLPRYQRSYEFAPVVAAIAIMFIIPVFSIALLVAWRLLHVADIQSRALRAELKVWQRPTPGASWKQQAAATARAAEASGDLAPA